MNKAKTKRQQVYIAVDVAAFRFFDGELQALLVQMNKEPYIGQWAMPGGLIQNDEKTDAAAHRLLKEQANLDMSTMYMEQLATFDDPNRDAGGRVVSVSYVALMYCEEEAVCVLDRYKDMQWMDVGEKFVFAYDHERMFDLAVERLRSKLTYSNIAFGLLPKEFPLSQLHELYEQILGKTFDKRNFRKKVLSLGLIEETGKQQSGTAHRPAQLFRFREQQIQYIDIL